MVVACSFSMVVFLAANRMSTPYEVASPHQSSFDVSRFVEYVVGLSEPTVYACAAGICDGTESKPNPEQPQCGRNCTCVGYYCKETGNQNKLCGPRTCMFPCNESFFCQQCLCTENKSCDPRGPI